MCWVGGGGVVQPLPQSQFPLVWDFGQLNTQVEDLYISDRWLEDMYLQGNSASATESEDM